MAGDWIKMRTDLQEDPAVFRIASLTKCDRLSVVGRLYAFWSWADKHAVDGRVDAATSTDVDVVVALPGFAQALESVKWLEVGDGFIAIPNSDRHNGHTAKERALKNQRQAKWRKRDATVDAHTSTTPSTREEKRREDKDIAPSKRKRPLPEDWSPQSSTTERLSREFGLVPEDVDRYVAAFRDTCRANAYTYSNFDSAFANCVRQDWPKFRNGQKVMPRSAGFRVDA